MPFTPYHAGPGAFIKAALPQHFSFTIFCLAQFITDLETAYHIFRGDYPLHRWFHTYLGASFVALFVVIFGRPLCQFALRIWTKWSNAPFKRYFPTDDRISFISAIVGAFVGTYSHVFLDSIVHPDVVPFRPFYLQNPFYDSASWPAVERLCIAMGLLGAIWLAFRLRRRAEPKS